MDRPYGVDVSHHQRPGSLPWSIFAQRSSFAIVRATYGTMRDKLCAEHVRKARSVGLRVGLYHFYRPSQDPDAQLAAFREVAAGAGYRVGDIVPALDVEADPIPKPGTAVSPAWQEPVKHMLDALVAGFGEAMVYITQREFGHLGKPAWVLERPLWVAFYSAKAKLPTPGNMPATIWQHRVGPYDPDAPGGYIEARPDIDQNRLLKPLPLATRVPWATPDEIEPTATDDHDDEWDELCARAMAQQFDHVDMVRAQAMRDLSGLESMPPGTDDEGGLDA